MGEGADHKAFSGAKTGAATEYLRCLAKAGNTGELFYCSRQSVVLTQSLPLILPNLTFSMPECSKRRSPRLAGSQTAVLEDKASRVEFNAVVTVHYRP
jgi:hypothetical protein